MGSKKRKLLSTFLIAFLWQFLCSPGSLADVCRDDNYHLGAKLGFPVFEWRDSAVHTKAIVVAFHGMTFYGLAFNDIARHLASQGYPVYAYDFRGFGLWQKDKLHYPSDGLIHFGQSIEDGQKLVLAVHEENQGEKLICLGESLGSNIALALISTPGEPIDGAVLSGLGVKAYMHPQPRWIVDFVKGLMHSHRPMNLTPYIKPNLAAEPELTKIYLADPLIYRQLSPADLIKASVTNKRSLKNVEQIPSNMPILVMAGAKDRIFKVKALSPLIKRMGSQHTTLKILPGEGHLLLELRPVPVAMDTIDTWLAEETQLSNTVAKK